jgi:8-hydroxy-5-deazaflavin:NADPH oxidoreductase
MNIAIIGAGNVGKALGKSLVEAGHRVTLAASSADSARAAAEEIGATAAVDSVAAVDDAEAVILAVPYVGAADEVSDALAEAAAGRIVVDVTNPLKPDYSGLAVENTSAAEEFQRRLPRARVVKAFNTVFAANQPDPAGRDAFIAGDDADAKRTVADLAESMGFTPLDVGPLSSARQLEGMAWLNISLNAANGWDWTSTWRLER